MPARLKKASPAELVARLKKREADSAVELRRRLKQAQKTVAAKIEASAAKGAAATSARARNSLYAEITSIYDVQAAAIDDWMKELVERTAVEWHGQAAKEMRTLAGGRGLVQFDRRLVQRYWELIHGGNSKHLAGVFTEKMGADDLRHLRGALVDTFRQQAIEGWTARETHKALQSKWDFLAKNLRSDRFVDAGGRRWANADYLNMLTRTTFAKVARESYVDTLVAEGYGLARITDDGDPCPICRAWSGLIVDISGRQKTHYPSLSQAYDAGWGHPNCSCRLEYLDPDLDKAEIDRQRKQPAAAWKDPAAVQDYNDEIRIREKRDEGMTVAEAERDLKRDKLKRELLAGGFEFTTTMDKMPDQVLDQMNRTGIPSIELAKKGDTPNSSRDSSLGGVLHLDPNAGPGQFRRALYTLEAKRGVQVADWRGLPPATDEDTAIGHFALFKDTVTPEEKAALLKYTHKGSKTYARWNKALRAGAETSLSVEDQAGIEKLSGVIGKGPRFEGETWRGMGFGDDPPRWRAFAAMKEGEFYPDKAFVSSSFSLEAAQEHATTAPKVFVRIHGESGVPLFDFSVASHEKEVLFNRNTFMKVLKSRVAGDTVFLEVREVSR